MRVNGPVTQREIDYPEGVMLVSTTDAQARITHCNAAFVAVSGFSYEELLGQPHNLVRHPDMPQEAFRDMWATVGRGRPWSAVVKNRCKNGDHYWVLANVTPVVRDGKNVGYMSVRQKPTRRQVEEAEALYADLRDRGARASLRLHAGGVRRVGWRDLPYRVFRLSLSQRFILMLMGWVTLVAAAMFASADAVAPQILPWGLLVLGALTLATWFHRSISVPIKQCTGFAAQIAGCNLKGDIPYSMRHPIGRLLRNVRLINLNMQAVVDDVRAEVAGMTHAATEIAKGSQDLAARTEEQSMSVERTASAMEQITSVVRQTSDNVIRVDETSQSARDTATAGGESVGDLVGTMKSIDSASARVRDVIGVIEGLAFQTNILSLNAAVEAARAGEQGRGFGVVASEVRALANRCSEAVKEIRGLIGDSNDQVERGTRRVTSAAEVICRVVDSVGSVSLLVKEIAQATSEQSRGIVEVNAAVSLLEQGMQHNAALAEQTAAACESLQARAGTLTRSVQIFHRLT